MNVGSLLAWLNANAGAVQALTSVLLAGITTVYAGLTFSLARSTRQQAKLLKKAQEPSVRATIGVAIVDIRLEPETVLAMQATNTGQLPVTIQLPFVIMGKEQMLALTGELVYTDTFPFRLEPGASCRVMLPAWRVARAVEKLGLKGKTKFQARFPDEAGNEYLSKPLKVDASVFANMATDEPPPRLTP